MHKPVSACAGCSISLAENTMLLCANGTASAWQLQQCWGCRWCSCYCKTSGLWLRGSKRYSTHATQAFWHISVNKHIDMPQTTGKESTHQQAALASPKACYRSLMPCLPGLQACCVHLMGSRATEATNQWICLALSRVMQTMSHDFCQHADLTTASQRQHVGLRLL